MTAQAFMTHIESVVAQRLGELKIPGAALALIEDGRVATLRCFGLADRDSGTPISDSTLFRLASVSKPFAAWAVMILVERGQVELDAPIDRYLTRWQLPPSAFARNGVTVRRLLAHTAGISTPGIGRAPHGSTSTPLLDGLEGRQPPPNLQQQRYYRRWELPPDAPITLAHEPGSGHRYSNGGYAMLELLVEEVSGSAYEAFVGHEILQPLGMRSSAYDPLPASLRGQVATPHFEDGSAVADWQHLSKAAGGLWASIADLASFACAELSTPQGAPAGRGVLSPTSIAAMFAPHGFAMHEDVSGIDFDTGLGHFVCTFAGRLNVHHAGGFSGWRSIYSILPQTGQGFCMLVNSDAGNSLWQPLLLEWANSVIASA